jgi:hypothetical protein
MIGCIVIAMKPAGQEPAEPKEAEVKDTGLTPAPGETIILVSETIPKKEEVIS